MIAVIGAGLGGLAAAVRLAQLGHEVVLYEQHEEVGGFATNFRRGAYTFEASLHALDGTAEHEPNGILLQQLGVRHRLRLRPLPDGRRERWLQSGLDLELPHEREAWLRCFNTVFPGEAEEARGLFGLAERLHDAVHDWMARGLSEPGPEARAAMTLTVAELLARHLRDPRAIHLFGSMTTWLGLPQERLGALPYLVMMHGYYNLHPSFPEGGSRAIAEALHAELSALGGRVCTGTPVRGLRCRRRRVVALDVGHEVPVRAVIAACSPRHTFGVLLAPSDVPPRVQADLSRLEISASIATLHLGVRDADSLPPMPHAAVLHELEHPLLPSGRVSVIARHRLDPGSCPAGHGVFAISTGAPNQEGDALVLPGLREALLDVVETHLLPGLSARVEVSSWVHPGTWIRYTGTPMGATFGFAMTPAQSGVRGLGPRTQLEGLYQAGAWVRPGPGQTAALRSGWLAAEALREDLG